LEANTETSYTSSTAQSPVEGRRSSSETSDISSTTTVEHRIRVIDLVLHSQTLTGGTKCHLVIHLQFMPTAKLEATLELVNPENFSHVT
jgi:hypothetical protein